MAGVVEMPPAGLLHTLLVREDTEEVEMKLWKAVLPEASLCSSFHHERHLRMYYV